MADRLPIVSIAGEKKELPSADTIAQSKINGLVSALALKAPLAAPVFTGISDFSAGGAYFGTAAAANLLDDYEEGTWTPSLGGTTTYSIQQGSYTKVGDQITANFDVAVTTIGTGSTVDISGLPFTSVSGGPQGITGGIGYFSAISTSIISIFARIDPGSSTLLLASLTAAGTVVAGNALFADGARITGSVTYKAA
jgi:hypothetical protein